MAKRIVITLSVLIATAAVGDDKKPEKKRASGFVITHTNWLTVVDVDRQPAAMVRVDFKCSTGEAGGFTSDTGAFAIKSGHKGPCSFFFTESREKAPGKSVTLDAPRLKPPVVLDWKVPQAPLCLGVLVGKTDCTIVSRVGALDPVPCTTLEAKLTEIAKVFPLEHALSLSCLGCEAGALLEAERQARKTPFTAVVFGAATTIEELQERCESQSTWFAVKATQTDALALVRTCTALANVPPDLREGLLASDCPGIAVCARGRTPNSSTRVGLSFAVESLDLSTEAGRAAKAACQPLMKWLSP